MQVLKVALRIRRRFTSLDIHYNNGQNSESQNPSEPNKETSNKSCQL